MLFAGCQGYREIDSEYLITAIGFEEKEGKFTVFTEVLEIAADKKDTKSRLFLSDGKTPYEAVENIADLLPKKAVFDHCPSAIIGSEIKGETLKRIIKYLYDTKNLNLGICLYCTDDIKELLSLKPQTNSVGYDINAIKSNIEKTTGIPFKNKYYEICSFEIEKKAFCLPQITVNGEDAQISNLTVYSNFSPSVCLTKSDAVIFNLLSFGSKGGEFSVSGEKYRVNRVRVKTKNAKDGIKIELHCKIRDKKENRAAKLKGAAEAVVKRVKNTPAAALVSPHLAVAKNVKVIVYEN